jgi:hypothetical protein
MAFARTREGARKRVNLKRRLRRAGFKVKADATTKELERRVRKLI